MIFVLHRIIIWQHNTDDQYIKSSQNVLVQYTNQLDKCDAIQETKKYKPKLKDFFFLFWDKSNIVAN